MKSLKKALVTGASGQLGYDIIRELERRRISCTGCSLRTESSKRRNANQSDIRYISLDISKEALVKEALLRERPDAVIHCAGWTAVDAAEDAVNRDAVRRANVDGTANIARACKDIGCKMMYISTDYVFNGKGETPWRPDSQDFNPLNYYGYTKLLGEQAVAETLTQYFIVRISWAFGINGKNFVETMLHLGKKMDTVRVVNDQIGSPTYTRDLARLLADMIETERYGYYHASNEGEYVSWADFAREIFRQAGMKTQVIPVSTEEYGLSKAARPHNSRLDKSKLREMGFEPLPEWQDALARYLEEKRITTMI